jgi:hypothetical protein
MPRTNLNTQTKRKRELARKDKREAKERKRALRKAEARSVRAATAGAPPVPPAVQTPTRAATKPDLSLAAQAFLRRTSKTP